MNDNRGKIFGIGEFAGLTQVTERTLRYYDRKGLLKPSIRNEHGHRFYKEQDLIQLQKILTLKFLDFSLEEIADSLHKPEANLQETLLAQYEMLKLKQEQINRVIQTLERMRQLLEGAGTIDSDLLLAYIHNVIHERHVKEWLNTQLSSSLVRDFLMEDLPPEVKIDLERQTTIILMQLKECYQQGKKADDPDVQAIGWKLIPVIEDIIGPLTAKFSEEDIKHLEQLDESAPPGLLPSGLTKEEEAYFLEVLEKMDVVHRWMGGAGHAEPPSQDSSS